MSGLVSTPRPLHFINVAQNHWDCLYACFLGSTKNREKPLLAFASEGAWVCSDFSCWLRVNRTRKADIQPARNACDEKSSNNILSAHIAGTTAFLAGVDSCSSSTTRTTTEMPRIVGEMAKVRCRRRDFVGASNTFCYEDPAWVARNAPSLGGKCDTDGAGFGFFRGSNKMIVTLDGRQKLGI